MAEIGLSGRLLHLLMHQYDALYVKRILTLVCLSQFVKLLHLTNKFLQ